MPPTPPHVPDDERIGDRDLAQWRTRTGRRFVDLVARVVAVLGRVWRWSLANLARFKYLGRLGSTPGHVQQWGRRGFVKLASKYFRVERVHAPFPWTMIWGTKR